VPANLDNLTIIECSNLLDGKLAQLCMVQPPPITANDLLNNQPRPLNLQAVRNLLHSDDEHDPPLAEFIPANRPAILCFPELAFLPDDWVALDELVRGYPGSLMLAAGFGFADGPALMEWASATGDTRRQPIWDNTEITRTSRYNGAWIWVKDKEKTICCAILKNHPAANMEFKNVENWQGGQRTLAIRAQDVTIYPLICFDILSESNNAPIDRVLADIEQSRPKNALILGMLLQGEAYHVSWGKGLNRIATRLHDLNTFTAVALCHYAHDDRYVEEPKDRWRSLTGLFRPTSCLSFWDGGKHVQLKEAVNPTRIIGDDQMGGVVVRHTQPVVIGGSVPFTYVQGNDCFVWAANKAFPLDAAGNVDFEQSLTPPPAYEAGRILQRHKRVEGREFGPIARDAVAALTAKLKDKAGNGIAQRFCAGVPIGDCPETPPKLSPDQLAEQEADWLPSALAIAVLKDAGNMTECPNAACLDLAVNDNTPVWRAWQAKNLNRHQIHEKLQSIAAKSVEARPLVIVVRGEHSQQPDNRVFRPDEIRRMDQPANQTGREIDRSNLGRVVHCISWGHFAADVLHDQDRKRAEDALRHYLQHLAPPAQP
jgi:hypothetical protein